MMQHIRNRSVRVVAATVNDDQSISTHRVQRRIKQGKPITDVSFQHASSTDGKFSTRSRMTVLAQKIDCGNNAIHTVAHFG